MITTRSYPLEFVIGSAAVSAVAEVAYAANRVLERDPHYAAELARWTPHEPAPGGARSAPAERPADNRLPNRARFPCTARS